MVGHVVTFQDAPCNPCNCGGMSVYGKEFQNTYSERHPICDDDKSDRISPIQLFQPKRNVQRNKARYARKKRHKCLENAVCTWNPMLAHPYTETTINAAGYSIMAP